MIKYNNCKTNDIINETKINVRIIIIVILKMILVSFEKIHYSFEYSITYLTLKKHYILFTAYTFEEITLCHNVFTLYNTIVLFIPSILPSK